MEIVKKSLTTLLRSYKSIRSSIAPRVNECAFYPTCSEYAIGAIETHGVVVGTYKSVVRLARCHPWATPRVDQP